MGKKFLKPVRAKDSWHKELEAAIRTVIDKTIYEPAFAAAEIDEKENAKKRSALIRAIEAGEVVYGNGRFKGKPSAAISKELRALGAQFDKREKAWKIAATSLPPDTFLAAIKATAKTKATIQKIFGVLEDIPKRVTEHLRDMTFAYEAEKTARRVHEAVDETVRPSLGVTPVISPKMREKIKDEYTETVTKSIKGFSQEMTEKLRKRIEVLVMEGRPRDELRQILRDEYAIGRERAKFIARQETSLFTSKLKQTQYESVDITQYRWHAIGGKAGDGRTRDEHKRAHGKIFNYDLSGNPVRDAKGKPVNPGEDFGCRCVDEPVLEEIG